MFLFRSSFVFPLGRKPWAWSLPWWSTVTTSSPDSSHQTLLHRQHSTVPNCQLNCLLNESRRFTCFNTILPELEVLRGLSLQLSVCCRWIPLPSSPLVISRGPKFQVLLDMLLFLLTVSAEYSNYCVTVPVKLLKVRVKSSARTRLCKSGPTTVTLNIGIVASILLLSMPVLTSCFQSCRSISQPHNIRSHISSSKPLKATIFRRMDHVWRGRMHDNEELVSSLRANGMITSSRVADAMEQIDRGIFVPPGADPYMDSPVPIGYNATISAPHMHASCLELLKDHLQPGMRTLDVGAGSGYLTAIFALLVGETGHVVGVEHIPELTDQAVENVQKSKAAHLLASGILSLHTGDGRLGFSDLAPYDAIHVGAAAATIPPALLEQLKPGGRMVIPVGDVFQDLIVIDKDSQGEVKKWEFTAVRYVPLTDPQLQLGKE